MRTHHFIPKAEIDLHTQSDTCDCEPTIIQPYMLNECEYEGEIVYEHHLILPEMMQEVGEDHEDCAGLVLFNAYTINE